MKGLANWVPEIFNHLVISRYFTCCLNDVNMTRFSGLSRGVFTNDLTLLTAATKTVMVQEIENYELQLQIALFTLLVVFSHRMRQEHI